MFGGLLLAFTTSWSVMISLILLICTVSACAASLLMFKVRMVFAAGLTGCHFLDFEFRSCRWGCLLSSPFSPMKTTNVCFCVRGQDARYCAVAADRNPADASGPVRHD